MRKIIFIILIISFLIGINYNSESGILTPKFVVENYAITLMEDNDMACPGILGSCHNQYDLRCHITDPIKGYYVSAQVCDNRGGGYYHMGIDLTRGSGDGKIYAAFDGTIIATTNSNVNCAPGGTLSCSAITCPSSRGISVTIKIKDGMFDNFTVHYMHMSSLNVKVGDTVRAGDYIGMIGNTGCSTGEHLHFQINTPDGTPTSMNEYFTDPSAYICGWFTKNDTTIPTVPNKGTVDYNNILKDSNNETVKATIGNCPGVVSSNLNQGIELITNTTATVYVQALVGGLAIPNESESCGTGLTIRADNGERYTYCYMEPGSLRYKVGDYVEQYSTIGIVGKSGDASKKSLLYIVQRNGDLVDTSLAFLNIYGGRCTNYKEKESCSRINNVAKYQQCVRMRSD